MADGAPDPSARPSRPGGLGRRRFVRTTATGAILLGAGGLFAWRRSGYVLPDGVAGPLATLDVDEYVIARAAAARILRSDEPGGIPADDPSIAVSIDAFVARLDARDRRDVSRLLAFLEHVAPLGAGRVTRFTSLDGEAQDATLEAMMTSRSHTLRMGFEALKALTMMGAYADPRAWAAIGYDGPLVGRPLGGWGS